MRLVTPRWETPTPPGVMGSYGPAVRRWAKRKHGIRFGPWQSYVIDAALRFDKLGDIIARIALFSTARQNGKSVIVRCIIGWILDEGRHLPAFREWTAILAAAHDAKQARIIYRGVWMDFVRLDLPDHNITEWRGISVDRLHFDTVTSQPGSARGISAGLIAWDEVLTQHDWDMWEALGPTQSAQRSPLMILTSTAGQADSVVLRAFYDRLRRQATGDEEPDPTFYGAWWESEDKNAGLDWAQLRQANPALGDGRLTEAAIKTEYGILPPDSWARERLNHFVDVRAAGAFNLGVWGACRVRHPLDGLQGPYALAVDIQPRWERATIAVAGVRDDGRVGVELYRDLRDGLTAERIIAEVKAFPDPVVSVTYEGISGGLASFRRDADVSGIPWVELKPHDVMRACMDVTEMIQSAKLAVDDPLLDAQIAWTARRPVGPDGGFRFSRSESAGPIDAVMAMTFAANAIQATQRTGFHL